MEQKGYILIVDDPFTTKQITEYLNNNLQLRYVLVDMELLLGSISTSNRVIVFLDFFRLGKYQLNTILKQLTKRSIVVITSTIPLDAYPAIKKHLLKFRLYELNKPFSEETFIRCINRIITE